MAWLIRMPVVSDIVLKIPPLLFEWCVLINGLFLIDFILIQKKRLTPNQRFNVANIHDVDEADQCVR